MPLMLFLLANFGLVLIAASHVEPTIVKLGFTHLLHTMGIFIIGILQCLIKLYLLPVLAIRLSRLHLKLNSTNHLYIVLEL